MNQRFTIIPLEDILLHSQEKTTPIDATQLEISVNDSARKFFCPFAKSHALVRRANNCESARKAPRNGTESSSPTRQVR